MKSTIKIIIGLLVILLAFGGTPTNAQQSGGLMFIENVGQFDSRVQYQTNLGGATLNLTGDALWLTAVEPLNVDPVDVETVNAQTSGAETRKGVNLKLGFVDANPQPRIEPFGPLNTPVSFFHGSDSGTWQSNVPVWSGVRYVDLYPDADLEIGGQNGQLSLRLVAKNGDAPEQVQLQIDGADGMALGDSGTVQLTTAVGQVDLPLLQPVDESGNPLDTPAPTIDGNTIANPFASSPPRVSTSASRQVVSIAGVSDLIYSTFLGGEGYFDYGYGITIDDAGYTYVTGQAGPGFPSTPGVFDPDIGGVYNDVFIAKLTPDGSDLVFATFLGGSDWETSYGIEVDNRGNSYVMGHTASPDFPTTPGAFDDSLAGPGDVYVTKLNPTGTALIYSTLFGGFENDSGWDMALDESGHVYVTGTTSGNGFPTTPGALDDTNNDTDAFVVKLNVDGSNLDYASYLGGSGFENGHGIALDPEGNIYVAGRTGSDDFPTSPGAFDTNYERNEGFVTKLTPSGSAIVYSTMIGGNDVDDVEALAVDNTGHAYITGNTRSADFPTTPNAFDPECSECARSFFSPDAFVAKFNADGTALEYSTFLGGDRPDYGQDIGVSENGRAYVTGFTYSFDFPTTPDSFDPICESCDEGEYTFTKSAAFVSRVSLDGSALEYSTYLGGSDGPDLGTTLAADNSGNVYVTGFTRSPDFPVTTGAFDTLFEGYYEVFVSKLATGSDEPEPESTPTPIPEAPPVPPHNCGPTPLGEITVGNTPRGVDVDPLRERVYVANSNPGSVSVIDSNTNAVLQSIAPISSATGVAYDPTQNIIWVTNSNADTLTPIQANGDATGFSVLPTILVGQQPWGVAYEPLHNYVYIVNNLSESVTVVDAVSRAVVATLTGSFSAPWHVAANPVTGKVYVANSGNNSVTVIDGTSVSGVVSLYDSGSPYGIAVDELHDVVYVATVQSHRIVAIGNLWGQPDKFLGWASFQRGYNPNRPVPLRAIAVNPQVATGDGGHVWATTSTSDGSEANQALFIPKGWVNRFHVPFTQNVGPEPTEGIAIDRLSNRVYVTSGGSPGTVTVIGDHNNVCPGIAPAAVMENGNQITLDIYSVVSLTRSDVKQDGVINILDLTLVATQYGSSNATADVTGDGRVDIFDLTTIAANFGRSVPGVGGE